MSTEQEVSRRVFLLQVALSVLFFTLGVLRLNQPHGLGFDERYYIGAAINLAEGHRVVNREHPMLAKEIISLGWLMFGDNLVRLRLLPLLFGTAGLFFASRAFWYHSRLPFAAVMFSALLATGLLLLSLSRLTLLEPFMFGFAALATYFLACGKVGHSGVAIGLSIACKWTAIPLAAGLFAVPILRRDGRGAFLFAALSASAYTATFIPGMFVAENRIILSDLPELHLAMRDRLALFVRDGPHSSQWWQWLYGGGALYVGSGGLTIAANAVTALPAFLATLTFRDKFVSLTALTCLAFFPLSGKHILYIHQFLVPHALMLAALALVLQDLPRWIAGSTITASAAFLAYALAVPDRMPSPRNHGPLTVTPERQKALEDAVFCLENPVLCYFNSQYDND